MTTIDTQNLDSLRLPELQTLYAEVTGKTTKSPNKKFLTRKIREALDAQAAEIIQEEQAIEKIQTEPANAEASTTEEPAKPAKAKRAKRSKKAAPAVEETTTEAIATEQDIAAGAEHSPTSDDQDEPGTEEIDALADAADIAEAAEGSTSDDADGAADHSTPDDTAETAAESEDSSPDEETPLRKLSIPELQARYHEVVGRPTGSSHRRYLIWKIREAQKGRVPVGPRTRRSPGEPAPEYKILPFRMEAEVVDRLDAARERMGLKSRMDLFRHALAAYLDKNGESELAAAMTTQS
jgi:hypothetical protein